MRFGRGGQAKPTPAVELPKRATDVSLVLPGREGIRARVLEVDASALVVAIMVPTKPISREQLAQLVLEFVTLRGRVRLTGAWSSPDPADRDVLRLQDPRSVEVVQEREYVRIHSSRPVVVYAGPDRRQEVQSFTVDISGGGLLLAGPDTLRIGDRVDFELTLVSGELPVIGKGRVVRVDNGGRRAVTFEDIRDLDRRRLVRFIFDIQRAQRQRGL